MKNYLKFVLAVSIFTVATLTTNHTAHAKARANDGTCDKTDENCGTDANGNTICGHFSGPC